METKETKTKWQKVKSILSWPFKKAWSFIKGGWWVVRHPGEAWEALRFFVANVQWAMVHAVRVGYVEQVFYAFMAYFILLFLFIVPKMALIILAVVAGMFFITRGDTLLKGYRTARDTQVVRMNKALNDMKVAQAINRTAVETARVAEQTRQVGKFAGDVDLPAMIEKARVESQRGLEALTDAQKGLRGRVIDTEALPEEGKATN